MEDGMEDPIPNPNNPFKADNPGPGGDDAEEEVELPDALEENPGMPPPPPPTQPPQRPPSENSALRPSSRAVSNADPGKALMAMEMRRAKKAQMERELDAELHRIRAQGALNREETYDTIATSKDRSQALAALALLILEVAVIKDMSENRDRYDYFKMLFVLICIAIVFTIAIGFLLLALYHTRSKAKKLSQNLIEQSYSYGTFKAGKVNVNPDVPLAEDMSAPLVEDPEPNGCFSCSPCCTCCEPQETLEDRLLAMYKRCYVNEIRASLDFANAQTRSGMTDGPDALNRGEDTMGMEEDMGMGFPQDVSIADNMTDDQMSRMLDDWHNLKSIRKQGAIILRKAVEIQRSKLHSKMASMQNAVTYLNFILCIIIIFILGFGLSTTVVVVATTTNAPEMTTLPLSLVGGGADKAGDIGGANSVNP